jgi:hypothetical protein
MNRRSYSHAAVKAQNPIRRALSDSLSIIAFAGAMPLVFMTASLKTALTGGIIVYITAALSALIYRVISAKDIVCKPLILVTSASAIACSLEILGQTYIPSAFPDTAPTVLMTGSAVIASAAFAYMCEKHELTAQKAAVSLAFVFALMLITGLVRELLSLEFWGMSFLSESMTKVGYTKSLSGGFFVFAVILALLGGILRKDGEHEWY